MSAARRRHAPWVGLVLLGLAGPGCPVRPPGPDPRPRVRPARPAVEVRLRWHAPRPAWRAKVRPLPPFPRFRDPHPLPRRSLKQSRRLAYVTTGAQRQQVITDLAAQLWQLANLKVDRIRALEAAARAAGRPAPAKRIRPLQHQVTILLRECVTLLEGVLESRLAPPAAGVRLAHYLRALDPAAATRWFRRLLARAKEPARRRALALDLAQLWLGQGEARRAWEALRVWTKGAGGARARLLRALAASYGGASRAQVLATVTPLLRSLSEASPAVRGVALAHLPAVLARLARPAERLRSWARASSALFHRHGRAVTVGLVRALVAQGRLQRAARVLTAAAALSVPVPAPLRTRLELLTGRADPTAHPPAAPGWRRLVLARLPALAGCGFGVGTWALEVEVSSAGRATVRSLRRTAARRRPMPGVKGSARRPTARPGLRCLQRRVGHWRFPPWRARSYVRLRIRVGPTASGTGRGRSRATDPG